MVLRTVTLTGPWLLVEELTREVRRMFAVTLELTWPLDGGKVRRRLWLIS